MQQRLVDATRAPKSTAKDKQQCLIVCNAQFCLEAALSEKNTYAVISNHNGVLSLHVALKSLASLERNDTHLLLQQIHG